uniref:ATP synthase CF0 subunit I n=1 Tax=Pseudochlorodesmis sp. HV01306a TaxID=2358488 RepID=A0A386AY43_9CHLO|nr:ATP synthase CF0 subunit I [Pseudochlorodesmis sp. HV01306a]
MTIVIFFVGDAVQSLLAKRQESIFYNLQQAQARATEIEQSYLAAQTKFKQTTNEVIEINNQTKNSIEQQEKQYQLQLTQNLQRLQELQESTIYYQQQKIQKQIKQSLIDFATQKVDQKFQAGLNPKVQKSVNTLSIKLLLNK